MSFDTLHCSSRSAGIVGVVAIFVLLAGAATGAEHGGDVAVGEDLGEVSGSVTVETPSDLHVYYRAYVANASHVSPEEVREWEPVTVDASLQAPNDIWNADLGGDPVLFTDSAAVDLSRFDPGEYYIFFWGCGTRGSSSGATVPGGCRWLDPYRVELTEASECEQEGYSCVHPQMVRGESGQTRDYACGQDTLICYDFTNTLDVMLSGHMGAGKNGDGLAPENTIMAFRKAEEVGIDSVEFDVRRADDGYVVFHDADTSRTVNGEFDWIPGIGARVSSLTVRDTAVDTLTQLSPIKDYTEVGSDYAMSQDRAKQATIPSMEEALDYLAGSDLNARIELKGDITQDWDMARDVYNMVADRGLVDQSIFMSFEGTCDTKMLRTKRTCSYPGLEAIEDVSGGQATTAVLWMARKKGPSRWVEYRPEDMLDEAEGKFDIVVPRLDYDDVGAGDISQVGLKKYGITPEEFAQDAGRRGLDYAFMSYGDELGRDDVFIRDQRYRFEVEWVSANRIDNLVADYERVQEERRDEPEQDVPEDSDTDDGGSDGTDDGMIPIAP